MKKDSFIINQTAYLIFASDLGTKQLKVKKYEETERF